MLSVCLIIDVCVYGSWILVSLLVYDRSLARHVVGCVRGGRGWNHNLSHARSVLYRPCYFNHLWYGTRQHINSLLNNVPVNSKAETFPSPFWQHVKTPYGPGVF